MLLFIVVAQGSSLFSAAFSGHEMREEGKARLGIMDYLSGYPDKDQLPPSPLNLKCGGDRRSSSDCMALSDLGGLVPVSRSMTFRDTEDERKQHMQDRRRTEERGRYFVEVLSPNVANIN